MAQGQQLKSVERLIAQRQAANAVSTPGEHERLQAAYHDELVVAGAEYAGREELLLIALDQLVSEVAEARDAELRDRAERRGLIGNADAIPARGPYRA